MYGNKTLMIKVIKLFQEQPDYRDDRWGTIKYMLDLAVPDKSVVSTEYIVHTSFTVDRFFRYIQQHMPSLRGKNWAKRQKRGGRGFVYYEDDPAIEKIVLKYKDQLSLFNH